jgi:hypothetical protein
MEYTKLRPLCLFSLGSAVSFYIFFMASKHFPFFRDAAPFLEDPYDAVGSFSVLVALLVSFLNLIRLSLLKQYKIDGRDLFIVRGNLIVGWSILATLFADGTAILRAPPHQPLAPEEKILFFLMLLLFFLSSTIWIGNYFAKRGVSAPRLRQVETEMDVLFRSAFLAWVNPGKYPVRFSFLFSISFSVLLAIIQIIGEGTAPTLQQTALVFIIFAAIGTLGLFIILMLIGGYLGILGKFRALKD